MAIEELGNISSNNEEYIRQIRDAKRSEEYKKSSLSSEAAASQTSDKLNISDEARQAQEIEEYTKRVQDEPEVREEVVEQAKTELEDGTLDSDQVLDETADRLLTTLL